MLVKYYNVDKLHQRNIPLWSEERLHRDSRLEQDLDFEGDDVSDNGKVPRQ